MSRDVETYETVGALEGGPCEEEMAGCSRDARYGSPSARVVRAAEVEIVTKIIWGINVPYIGSKLEFTETDPIWVPCIRTHKALSFELCDICGSQVPPGRARRGITTCCPKCNKKKWDVKNGLVIEREKNACGVRPTMFWLTISYECFQRDNFTCVHCWKSREQLRKDDQSEYMIDGKINPKYKPEDYVLNCHHIKPIKDGGNNQLENLMTLCGKCHKIEHSRVRNIQRKHRILEV